MFSEGVWIRLQAILCILHLLLATWNMHYIALQCNAYFWLKHTLKSLRALEYLYHFIFSSLNNFYFIILSLYSFISSSLYYFIFSSLILFSHLYIILFSYLCIFFFIFVSFYFLTYFIFSHKGQGFYALEYLYYFIF